MNIELLNLHYQSRNKIWHWSEVYSYCQLLPSQIVQTQSFDPSIALLFSPKNRIDTEQILKHYTKPKLFKLSQNSYGVGTRLNLTPTIWANNEDWYFRQLLVGKYGCFLYSIPFAKKIWICGSTTLEIANSTSDIDLIIESDFPWICRIYFKIIFKLLHLDSYPFFASIWWKFWQNPNSKELVLNYKKTQKPKFDLGLICKNISDIDKYYKEPERQFSIYNRFLVLKNNAPSFENQIRHQEYPNYYLFLAEIFKLFLWLFLPVVALIKIFYKLTTIFINSKSKTLVVKDDFISFYPTDYQI